MKREKPPDSVRESGLFHITQAGLARGLARNRISRGRPFTFLALWVWLDLLWGVAVYG